MKHISGYTDIFMDPTDGMITIFSFPDLTKDYVWYGNRINRPQPSPIVKDIRIELRQLRANIDDTTFIIQHESSIVTKAQVLDHLIPGILRQDDGVISIQHLTHNKIFVGDINDYPVESDTIPFTALPNLTYKNLWRGDVTNRPEEIIRIDLYNLPAFLTLNPLNNFGIYNLYTGGFQLDILEPIAPTTTQRVDMSNLPNLQEDYLWVGVVNYTPPIITIDAIPPFIHVSGSLNWDPSGLFDPNHAVPTAVLKIKLKNLPDLPNKTIWIGDATSRPVALTKIFIDNLPNLTFNKIWVGDVTNRPVEGELPIEALPDLTYTYLWTGDNTNRPIEVQQIIIDNLPDLTNGRLWLGNIDDRPVITQTIQLDNLPNLTYLHLWQGDSDDRPEEILEIDIGNLPNLSNTRLWTGNGSNRPVETQTIILDNLPNLSYKNLWTGDSFDRPEEVLVLPIYNMADLAFERFWRGDVSNRPEEVTITGSGGVTVTHGAGNTDISGQTLQDEIDEINTEIDAINTHLSEIDTHLESLDASITTLEEEISALEIELDAAVTTLEAEIAALEAELLAAIEVVSDALAALTVTVLALGVTVAALELTVNAPIVGLVARLNAITESLTDSTLKAYVILKTPNAVFPNGQALDALSGGIMVGDTSGVISEVTITGTSNQIGMSNGNGISGNPTISISNNPIIPGTAGITLPNGTTGQRGGGSGTIRLNTSLNVFEGTTDGSTWFTFDTAGGTVTSVNISTSSSGVTVGGGPITSSGTLTVNINNELQALSGLSGTGIVVRTGTATYTERTVTGTSNQITVTNGDGIAANINVAIANNAIFPGTEGVTLPNGTTAQRPGSPNIGEIRFNTTTNRLEAYY